MDRPSTSTNPLFDEQDDAPNDYVTKNHLFGVQRALRQESDALGDRIEQLATDLRHSEMQTRDYLDAKLSSQWKSSVP
jgi:hypothetical protein